jgi:WD40-like Beta Propeller Repeat
MDGYFTRCGADPKNPRGDYGVEGVLIDGKTGQAAGAPEPVSNGLGWIGGPSVTSDGKRLLLWRGNALPQVFVSEFDRGTMRLSVPRRLTLDENANEPAFWTADSKSLLFLSDRGGAWKLFRQGLEQKIAEVAVESQNIQATLPRLSADGSEILFADVGGTEDPSAQVHLMGAPLAGGLPRLVLQDVGIDGFFCARKPAVTCVYNKVSGKTTSLIALDPRNGEARQIAKFDGWPAWTLSPAGTELAVVTDAHQGWIQFISLETAAKRDVVVKDWPVLRGAHWTADGRGVLIGSVTPRGTTAILNVDLKGNARVLLESDPNVQLLWAIPSPDGRHAALDVITGENNVWMVENF